jgi:NAD(P)-dependent dehydrogenase (short-subunit alcohol dehydrogenase family)
MTELTDRVAIVTGAGRGLGREHSLLLARLGAKVVVNDFGATLAGSRDGSDPAQETVDEIRAFGGQAVAHHGSVSDWDQSKQMIQTAIDTFGRLDILVNNAGIVRDRRLVNMSEQEFDAVVEVHLKGHFCPLRHAAEYWRALSKAGESVSASVINTTSGAGLRGAPGQINYSAAKAAIASLTLVAARELWDYGVRVNAIAPVARTRMTLATPGMEEKYGEPEENSAFDAYHPSNVSPLVAWLARADTRVSGQVFSVRGGRIDIQSTWTDREQFLRDGPWTQPVLDQVFAGLPEGPSAWVGTA